MCDNPNFMPASGKWVDDWNRMASPSVQAAFVRDCCAGMSKPIEWGQATMDFMTFALKMYAAGWAASECGKSRAI